VDEMDVVSDPYLLELEDSSEEDTNIPDAFQHSSVTELVEVHKIETDLLEKFLRREQQLLFHMSDKQETPNGDRISLTDCDFGSANAINILNYLLVQNKYYYAGRLDYEIEAPLETFDDCTYNHYIGNVQRAHPIRNEEKILFKHISD
jgi:hypothetical protein